MNETNEALNNDDYMTPPSQKDKIVSFVRKGFTPIADMEHLVEEFRLYYLEERKAGRTDVMQIFRDFRMHCKLYKHTWFNPYPHQIKSFIARWEQSLPMTLRKIPIKGRDLKTKKQREAEGEIVKKEIGYHELEDGAKNLQQMLIEDAEQLMKESNAEFQLIDENGGLWDKDSYEKIRLKKKEIALAISKDVLGGVHKHELVKIKRNKEGRETAGFLMDMMKSATAGELSEEELSLLETGIPTVG